MSLPNRLKYNISGKPGKQQLDLFNDVSWLENEVQTSPAFP